jgi:hypothetical protein
MVSFMRSCKKVLDYIGKLFLALCLCATANSAQADGIAVVKADTRAVENGYEIGADFKITLPPVVEEALKHGVVLNFVSHLVITRSRWYWMDADVIEREQNTKLSYNALTRQYRISRGTLFQGFQNLESALQVLGHQSAALLPASALETGGNYLTRVFQGERNYLAIAQMRLDIAQLPKPLQVTALTNNDWRLDSHPYSWSVQFTKPETEDTRQ